MADRYVTAAGGNWNNTATWSTTDGGAGGASVPAAADNVFLTASSGDLISNAIGTCRNVDCTGYTGTWSGGSALTVAGNLFRLVAGMTYSRTGAITFTGAEVGGGYELYSSDHTMSHNITVNAPASLVMRDELTMTGNITITAGGLAASGHDITCGQLASGTDTTRVINLGAITLTCTGNNATVTITNPNLTWTPPAELRFTGNNGGSINAGNELDLAVSWNDVVIDASSWTSNFTARTITAISIAHLMFEGEWITPYTIFFSHDITIGEAHFPPGTVVNGSNTGSPITMTSDGDGITFTDCILSGIQAAGSAAPFTANNCVDFKDNSDIIFGDAPPPLTHEVTGVTRDKDGEPLGEADVWLLKRQGDVLTQVDHTTSNETTGEYTLGAPDDDPAYLVVAQLGGSPPRSDVSASFEIEPQEP